MNFGQEELQGLLRQLVKVGRVVSVNDAAGTCRAVLPDADGMETYDLRVLQVKTHADRSYALPDVGEQVLCLFLPSGQEQGFVLGSFYSGVDPAPVQDRNKWHVTMKDGAVLEYDRAAHRLRAQVPGDAELEVSGSISGTAGKDITLTAPQITVNGTIFLNGPLTQGGGSGGGDATFKGSVSATGAVQSDTDVVSAVSLNGHRHPCPHGGMTGGPE
ncbi:phage baseplate assembly protein V [Desulfobaculum bizertense]|uniref:phage baseplate assembly protein V n=1 Tax=Desulfobaculum bizertense TaxID=376490 RepID=UPI001F262B6B|nr:phage baseplate assembly protein V [Desulfobaculum bizertense]UIJ38553.1 phage baseplate assembly protein V [Desulfobaculum bizertense]